MSGNEYSEREQLGLSAVLDAIVPRSADGRFPGAGELGIGREIEREVPALHPLVVKALDELDALARERGAADFTALDPDARGQALRAHAERDPGFLPGLVFQTYSRYYSQPRVVEALGLEPRPPYPGGYEMAPVDLDALLEPVRGGPRRYREG